MHDIEPHFRWRNHYRAEEDGRSPFYQRQYSELYFSNAVYDHLIHPQWDEFGSSTLYLKILYTDYEMGISIIELIGEWNDCIHNDIMYLKREIIDVLLREGINKFALIGENVLNFHPNEAEDDYYQEWFQDVEDGWVTFINFREHVLQELRDYRLDFYINFGGELDDLFWRPMEPKLLCRKVDEILRRRLATSW